ncbi:hypothetical protein EPN44_04820 [bacterium]|nr:MAG: hypothetical protein EPN44_04820 [bacterium]
MLLAFSLWLQQGVIDRSADASTATRVLDLPVAILPPNGTLSHVASVELLALAGAQALLLWLVYRAIAGRACGVPVLVGLGAAFLAMVVVDLGARTSLSNDAYAYIGYAKLASLREAYSPLNAPLSGSFAAVNAIWGVPLVPCIYGPAWLEGMRVLLSHATSLADAYAVLRLTNLALFVAVIASLHGLVRQPVLTALVALNPALHRLFIADVHNDLGGVLLVLVAFLFYRMRWRRVAIVAAALAGLVKLPLLAIGLLIACAEREARRRISVACAVLALGLAAYWAFVGNAYLAALRAVALGHALPGLHSLGARYEVYAALHVLLVCASLGTLAIAVVTGRDWEGGLWSLPTLASRVFPWYALWSLPLAALRPRRLASFLVAIPLVTMLMEHAIVPFGRTGTLTLVLAAFLAACLSSVYRAQTAAGWLRRRGTAEASRNAGNSSTENWSPVVKGPNSA